MSLFDFDEEGSNVQQLVEALLQIVNEQNLDRKAAYSKQAAMDITYLRMVQKRLEGGTIMECAEKMITEYQSASLSIDGRARGDYNKAIAMLQEIFKQITLVQEAGREHVKWNPLKK